MNQAQVIDLLLHYFNAYGYYIVFVLLLLENLFVIGLLVPGETVLLIASFAAAQGMLKIVYVTIIAAVGAILGNIAGYAIGRRGGRRLIEKYGGRFVSPERLDAAEKYFDVHGPKTVFIGRFAAGVRVFVPLLAGASKMNFAKFLAYTVAAVLSWTVFISLVGFFFGQNWVLISKLLSRFSLAILIIIAIFVTYHIIRRKRAGLLNRNDNNKSA